MASPRLVLALPTVLLLSSFISASSMAYDPGFISAGSQADDGPKSTSARSMVYGDPGFISAGSQADDGPKSTSASSMVYGDPGFISAGPKSTSAGSKASEEPEGEDDCDQNYWARHLTFDVSLDEFLERRRAHSPACVDWVPETDGCSHSPDNMWGTSFTEACTRHDFGYRNFGAMCILDHDLRKKVDKAFKDDLEDICEELSFFKRVLCKGAAKVYYAAVRAAGRLFATKCGAKNGQASR